MNYTDEYLAYCAVNHMTPDEMMAHDSEKYPGGKMTGYILFRAKSTEQGGR